jgi:hypothetical protein
MKRSTLLAALFVLITCGRPDAPVDGDAVFRTVSVCPLPGYAEEIDIAGNYAYVADDQGGLQIVDISDPESTFVVGSYLSEKSYIGIAVRDTFAYCAVLHSQGGIQILNVADPAAPFYVSEDSWYYGYNVFAPADDTMYVYVAGGYWFVVENVSNPQYPSFVRRFSESGDFRGVYVIDTIAYLACEQMGVQIFNLALPDSEALVGWADTPGTARDIFVYNDHAFVADGRSGIAIVGVGDIENPSLVALYNTPDYANDVHVVGDLAYIAAGSGGLHVIDITEIDNPQFYGEIETSYANGIYVRDTLIYLADRDMGLIIITEEAQ